MKTPEELAEEYIDKKWSWLKKSQQKGEWNSQSTHSYREAFLAGYAAAMERKGLVANAMSRQGLDPNKAEQNNAELVAISGKRFEKD